MSHNTSELCNQTLVAVQTLMTMDSFDPTHGKNVNKLLRIDMTGKNNDKHKKSLDYQTNAQKIKGNINTNQFHKPLLKFIAPYFNFDMKKTMSVTKMCK